MCLYMNIVDFMYLYKNTVTMDIHVTFGQGATIQPVPVRARVPRTTFGPSWDELKAHLGSIEPNDDFGSSNDLVPDSIPRRSRQPLHPTFLPGTFLPGVLQYVKLLNTASPGRFSLEMADPDQNQVLTLAFFVEPPGTSTQRFHEDVNGFRLFPVWNALYALTGPVGQGACTETTVAQSLFETKRVDVQSYQEGSIVFWDGSWPHRGTGNRNGEMCVQLHVLLTAAWVVRPLFGFDNALDNCIEGCRTASDPVVYMKKCFLAAPHLATSELKDKLTLLQVYHLRAELAREYEGGLLGSRNGFYEYGDSFDCAMFELYLMGQGPFFRTDLFNKFTWREERHVLDRPTRASEKKLRKDTLRRWKEWRSRVQGSDIFQTQGSWPHLKVRATGEIFPQSELGFWFCRGLTK